MPVSDNDPHLTTKREGSSPYSCHNGDRTKKSYWAPVRLYLSDSSFAIGSKEILNTMSRECRYDRSLTDPRCSDCKHQGSGENYAVKITASS